VKPVEVAKSARKMASDREMPAEEKRAQYSSCDVIHDKSCQCDFEKDVLT
jgi:hypothetical protein